MTSEKDKRPPFDADEVSVVLEHYLASSRFAPAAVRQLKRTLPVQPDVDLDAMLDDPGYVERLLETVEERKRCGNEAPTLLIAPHRVPATRVLGEGANLALIFSAEAVLFQDTVELLQLDATRWAEGGGRPRFNVIAVRPDWLAHGGHAKRALVTDTDGRVKDCVFAKPAPIHAAMVLHLLREGEREQHRRISAWCRKHGIAQLNPYLSAVRADDKAATHRTWRRNSADLDAPEFCLINHEANADKMEQKVRSFAEKIRGDASEVGVFIQPNTGTEGNSVFRVLAGENDGAAVERTKSILAGDDVILRNERGNVRFRCPLEPEKGFRRVTLRVNVACGGAGFEADSGYAQAAPDEDADVASRGRGGRIVDINHALAHLYVHNSGTWLRVIPSPSEVEAVKMAACAAASALNSGRDDGERLRLLGIDIVLEVRGEGRACAPYPVLLEANPRPAGLAHAREIRGVSNAEAQQTIAQHLFEGAAALLPARPKSS